MTPNRDLLINSIELIEMHGATNIPTVLYYGTDGTVSVGATRLPVTTVFVIVTVAPTAKSAPGGISTPPPAAKTPSWPKNGVDIGLERDDAIAPMFLPLRYGKIHDRFLPQWRATYTGPRFFASVLERYWPPR